MKKSAPLAAANAIHYTITPAQLHAHLYEVVLNIPQPQAQQTVSLPVWIPGSYLVREFSKNLQDLTASQGGQLVDAVQQGKNSWQIDADPSLPLTICYQICAYDSSVRTAWLDSQRGFFNGTSVFLRVHGAEQVLQVLHVEPPVNQPRWQLATGLTPIKVNKNGFGRYHAASYDELADCPVEMGEFWSAEFTAHGVPHRFVVAGAAPSFDAERLIADTQKICETEIRLWHPKGKPPFERYVFMLNVMDDNYGGLEHKNSTALICSRRDLPRKGEAKASSGYTTLLGLISHEYFHTWNVKRLRPIELASYDYERENYTELLWFFEGFTSYYDDLLLRRAGLVDNEQYLKLLNKTINQVLQTPGRHVQSVAEASYDAWVKYYRQDENTPNATVSYYTKGSLVALCLDLSLRREGKTTLDHVMRALYKHCKAGPMREQDLLDVLLALTGHSWAADIAAWVHGKLDLPLASLLESHGVQYKTETAQIAQQLGLRVAEGAGGISLKVVLRGGAAEAAGMMAGDEWLGIEPLQTSHSHLGWRLLKLDDLPLYAGDAAEVLALVARDKRLLRLRLQLPANARPASNAKGRKANTKTANTGDTVSLAVADATRVNRWLDGR
ncbi:M61 family metallopeptidase [Comamonas sp. J-3]|uniref:M61 family metallopeptidase n=1 Tax=Comamonas trifloxystrobinivorans TaxID=3350256 RepID=UPI00372C9DD6